MPSGSRWHEPGGSGEQRRTIPIQELDQLMPAPMRPLESLRQRLDDGGSRLGWTRISAFSRFATSPDDLVEWIDEASPDTLDGYRNRIRHFVSALASAEKCYARRLGHGSRAVATLVAPADVPELAAALTEAHAAAELFVPARGAALLGHDDFGCNLVFADEGARAWIEAEAGRAGLYSVRPTR
jgi:hypothetical protein